jgi:hypothetical protein
MNTDLFDHDATHLMGDVATHPIEQPWNVLAALFLLAGRNQRRRHAWPAHPRTAHRDASKRRIQDDPPQTAAAAIFFSCEAMTWRFGVKP